VAAKRTEPDALGVDVTVLLEEGEGVPEGVTLGVVDRVLFEDGDGVPEGEACRTHATAESEVGVLS
jgi:hypothetical protein